MDRSRQGQAPYGFRWQSGRLHVHAEEAAIRRKAFELFLKLRSMGAVARALNESGHKTRQGSDWSDVQARRILECPSAIGQYETNRSERTAEGKRRETARGERQIVDCEPLIEMSVWQRVTDILQSKRAARRTSPATALDGLLRCACSAALSHSAAAGKFTCPACGTSIADDDLEEVFADDFGQTLAAHPSLRAALVPESASRQVGLEITRTEGEKEKAEKDRAAGEAMFAGKSISKARFEQLHAPLDAAVADAEKRLAALRKKLEALPPPAPARTWESVWREMPRERRQRFIRTFVSHFTISPGEIEIAYLLPEPLPADTSDTRQIAPTNLPTAGGQPIYIRLPKPGEQCPYTGMSRAKLNELILPGPRNNHRPPVASKSLRQPGQKTGVRLILLDSLMTYLNSAGR